MCDCKSGEINYWTDLAQTLAHNLLYVWSQNRSYLKPVVNKFSYLGSKPKHLLTFLVLFFMLGWRPILGPISRMLYNVQMTGINVLTYDQWKSVLRLAWAALESIGIPFTWNAVYPKPLVEIYNKRYTWDNNVPAYVCSEFHWFLYCIE